MQRLSFLSTENHAAKQQSLPKHFGIGCASEVDFKSKPGPLLLFATLVVSLFSNAQTNYARVECQSERGTLLQYIKFVARSVSIEYAPRSLPTIFQRSAKCNKMGTSFDPWRSNFCEIATSRRGSKHYYGVVILT